MKKRTLLVGLAGLASGVLLAQHWRPLTKEGIKLGLKAKSKFQEVSQQAMEDFSDLTAEANQELSEHDREVM